MINNKALRTRLKTCRKFTCTEENSAIRWCTNEGTGHIIKRIGVIVHGRVLENLRTRRNLASIKCINHICLYNVFARCITSVSSSNPPCILACVILIRRHNKQRQVVTINKSNIKRIKVTGTLLPSQDTSQMRLDILFCLRATVSCDAGESSVQ